MFINKFKTIFLLLLLVITISCKKELSNNEKFIQNLSNDINFDLPMVNESLIIFVNKKDFVYATSLRQLYSIKEKYNKRIRHFDNFLIEVINNNLLSEKEIKDNSIFFFNPNEKILKDFDKKGIEYFKSVYCEISDTKRKYYIKTNLDLNTRQSIMYIFFKNNYYIMQDDYIGKDVLIDKNL
jgi:hypothetical protein